MTKQQQILANAEAFVRDVVKNDFRQTVDDDRVQAIARRVSKAIPREAKRSTAKAGNLGVEAAE